MFGLGLIGFCAIYFWDLIGGDEKHLNDTNHIKKKGESNALTS